MEGWLKNPIFRGGEVGRVPKKKQYMGGNCLKRWREGLGQFPDLRGDLAKKGGSIFEEEGVMP